LFQSVNDVVIAAIDLVSRQVVHCHRVLRAVQTVAEKSTAINGKTWDALLRFLLAVNDVLLAPPTEKGLHCLAFSCSCYEIFCCVVGMLRQLWLLFLYWTVAMYENASF